MSTVSQRFTKFLKNLQLTDDQIKDAITKHTGVRNTLHNHYYGSSKQTGTAYDYARQLITSYAKSEVLQEQSTSSTSYLVGSYGKNIAIRPPSDIDILFVMPSHLWTKYNGYYTTNGQSRLLQDVKNVLKQTYSSTDIRGDGQVVCVNFTSFAVEAVPVFATNFDYYKFPDTSGGGSWRDTNPKAEKSHISGSNSLTKGNTVPFIKMMKRWKRYCNVPLKSFAIELTAVDFLSTYQHKDKSEMYYDLMVRDYLDYLIRYKSMLYAIPGISESLNIGDAWLSRAETAHNRAKKACDFESSRLCRSATVEWKKIFGSDFVYLD